MFQGEYINNMDDKGRVNTPASFRDVLQKNYDDPTIIITKHPRNACLQAYPQREWKRLLAKLAAQPANDPRVQAFKRKLVGSAQAYTPDKQGRVLIPQSLRAYAKLDKSTVFVGMIDTFEIWDAKAWDAQLAEADALLQSQDWDF